MIARESVENLLKETEQEHRMAHALLISKDLYFLWTPEETKGMLDYLRIAIPKKYGFDDVGKKIVVAEPKMAIFALMDIKGIEPIMYCYQFVGFSELGKGPLKKS